MPIRSLLLLAVVLAASVTPWRPARAEVPVLGTWLTEDRDGLITVVPCGAMLCGRISGILKVRPGVAAPLDVYGRSQCGLTIMQGFTEQRPGLWSGTITDPESGKVYKAQMHLDEAGQLRLRGYIGIPLLGQTQVWVRYTGPMQPDCSMRRM